MFSRQLGDDHQCCIIVEDVLLSRDQTEEWKGWMQVMFVWYHYFKVAETYNAVRIYISAYVWMTGFGQFYIPLCVILKIN